MKRLKQISALLIFLPLFFYFSVPAASLWALNENTVSAGEQTYTAVKTLEQAQAEIPAVSADAENPNDFFNETPLSLPEAPISEELKTAAEVFLSGRESSEDVSESGTKSSGASSTWGLSAVNAQQAWTLTRGAGIVIAVVDTGLDFKHEDIKNNYFTNAAEVNGLPGVDDDGNGFIDDIRGWDFVNNDNNPTDDEGHGSHVSGIAAADSTNNKGIAGVAPDAKILAVKVLNNAGSGAIETVIQGIKYAADMGAQVINMSLGILKKYLTSPLLAAFQDAVNYATHKGSVIVTAAGNDGVDSASNAPSGLDNTIAVGAVDSSNKKPSWSNKNPDLVAPGVDILSLKLNGGYVSLSGTSMASPFVAGAAALIRAYYSSTYAGYTGEQIYNDVYTRLTESAFALNKKKDYDTNFGYGLLDAYKALTLTTSLSSLAADFSFSQSASGGMVSVLRAAGFEAGRFPENRITPRFQPGNWYRISAFETGAKKAKKFFRKPLAV